MKLQKMHIFGIVFAVILIILSFIFLRQEKYYYFILVISGIIGFLPFLVSIVLEGSKEKELDSKFLEFTRDLVEGVKSGTPISRSIVNLKGRNYGALTVYVQKLANQISLGIPLTQSLATFANDTGSPVIARAVNLISEAEKAGGKIDTIIESVSDSVNQTEQLKKERRSAVYNLVVQGYIIFMVFVIIMIVLEFKILPLIPSTGTATSLDVKIKAINPADFSMPLLVLLLVQALFSGLFIGKIAEGSLKNGIKHSFLLLALTLLIKTGATALFG